MNTNTTNTSPEREEIEQLLPWHVAGTLSRREAARVEAAIARDPELARQLDLIREELGETIVLNETLGAPSARAMERLMAGIEAESGPAVQAKPRFSFVTWVAEQLAALSPRTLAYGTTAAVLALLLQFGILTGVAVNTALGPETGYQTASGEQAAAPGSYVLIGFSADAGMGEITDFLERHDLAIVDGPRAGGMYRVRIADRVLPQAEAEAVVARLRESGVVSFIALTE